MKSKFKDQVIWITGASSGIGEATAKEFVARGAKVILTARREDRLLKLAHELNSNRSVPVAKILTADLSQIDAFAELAKRAIACFGKVDVLFNNAGVSQRGFAIDTDFEIERRMINLDLVSPIALTKAILPHMAERKSGRIIVTSSLMGELELPGNATYACVKHGINGYFLSLAYELKAFGIDVQIIMPGFVKTEVSMSAVTAAGAQHGKMDSTHENAMSSETFARKLMPKLESGKTSIVITGREGAALLVRRWFPSLYRFFVFKFAKVYLKDRLELKD